MHLLRLAAIILRVIFIGAALCCAIPLQASNNGDGTLRRIWVPILMYHYISPLPVDADEIRTELTVTPEIFETHLAYLQAEGYQGISLYHLYDALTTGAKLPEKPVILTFDDGHIDHYESVFPLLQRYQTTATFFIITGRADLNDPAYISWSQIVEMANAGMSMESHTKTHSDLRARSYDFLVYEMLGSIESLAAHTGVQPRMFCYPSGRYDDSTLAVLKTLPVALAVTTQFGAYHTTDNLLELPRLRVSGNLSAVGLAQLLRSSR